MVPHAIPKVGIGLPIAHNDDIDATSTNGSLATAALSAVHLAVVDGTIMVELTIAGSAPGAPRQERVSTNVMVPLTIHRGHVRGLYRGGPVVV